MNSHVNGLSVCFPRTAGYFGWTSAVYGSRRRGVAATRANLDWLGTRRG
jgi:hypothetical protein